MSGKTLWRVERPNPAVRESPDAYITPAWIEANGRAELIITGGDVVSGHDPATGKEYWRADVLNPDRNGAYRIVASPTIVNDLIIAPTRVIADGGDAARWQRRCGKDSRGVDVRSRDRTCRRR